MDATVALTRFQAALEQQVLLAGGDPVMEAAGRALLAASGPALRSLALDLAEQAAAEVRAQLPGHAVEVLLEDGEPALRVRPEETDRGAASRQEEPSDARVTLRLSPRLKELIEQAAAERGESLNSWLVRTLSVHGSRPRGRGQRIEGTIET
ncbi:MAG: toxin-antitoxin system HicB family antitoxin [Actinobacteria bacterium]|nr:toxin-antitoxin system HicB family antitoxin [Actinomycetota bacterium]